MVLASNSVSISNRLTRNKDTAQWGGVFFYFVCNLLKNYLPKISIFFKICLNQVGTWFGAVAGL